MEDLIERLEQLEQLELPNGAKGAVWLDDVIAVIKNNMYWDFKTDIKNRDE